MEVMKITVFLARNETGHCIELDVPSADCTISEVLQMVRNRLEQPVIRVLNHAERYGSELFLSFGADGPVRLQEDLSLSDYQLNTDCRLWLMCAPDQSRA